ncbi:MAG: RelA/SpoT family protein [Burkholderiales bacterium]
MSEKSNVIPISRGEGRAEEASRTPPVVRAAALAQEVYGEARLGTGEICIDHARVVADLLGDLRLDNATLCAAWLFALPQYAEDWRERVLSVAGAEPADLIEGLARLHRLRDLTRAGSRASEDAGQAETLRKMLLAMVSDVRVVLVRLASRLATLRHVLRTPDHPQGALLARETLDFYAPLANRLGVWQLKWELEDLAFRLTEPEAYKSVAALLATRRTERESYIGRATAQLNAELGRAGVKAQVAGRPKHIYSIWQKMRQKSLGFDDLYDVRALRVLVEEVRDCYTALGVVHNLWQPIPKEFDDYISRPKGNDYRSLHTAVVGPDELALEVQIRTLEMHQHAELGVAAHWRYKEAGARSTGASVKSASFESKVGLLRQLLAWRDEVAGTRDWRAETEKLGFDDTVYVLTPQGRVIDLPAGATPIDFAYRLHTDLGHRCRGARVDGALVPLNTPLATGQEVDIVVAKSGGPSRDWLNPALGFVAGRHARAKLRQWFSAQDLAETVATGRAAIERELQRLGRSGANLEQLAQSLGFESTEALFTAAARGEWSLKQVASAFALPAEVSEEAIELHKSRIAPASGKGVLIVGVDRLMTQLARCCKPAPPDAIVGFVTRGRGVSIHRAGCRDFANLSASHPERIIETQWGESREGLFAVDIEIEALDRPGLLRDIGELLTRHRANVTATNSQSRRGLARMAFTVEVAGLHNLETSLAALRSVAGVTAARRS